MAGDVSDPTNPIPGVITIDSDGTRGCSTTNTTIQGGGTGTEIRAVPLTGAPGERGEISLRALPDRATSCTGTFACKQSEVGTQVFPQPIPSPERATRHRSTGCGTARPLPRLPGDPDRTLPVHRRAGPYIDRLISSIGSSGAPAGYQRWSSTHSCSPSGTITVSGNWWVDCPTPSGLSINNGTTVTFASGNVVFDGGIRLNGGGALNINTVEPGRQPALRLPAPRQRRTLHVVLERAGGADLRAGGDWTLGGGTFTGNHSLVYLSPNSVVKGSGGAPPRWTAPTEGPFAGLSLWAEADEPFTVSGGSGVMLRGTFFTPFADELTLTGGGEWGQQSAQFISYRLRVSGGSSLTMAPDPSVSAQLPTPAATLIR